MTKELFAQICSFENVLAAAQRAARGKRHRPDVAAFLFDQERHCLRLADALASGQWQPGPYKEVLVREPKERRISVARFADRVVHQAICHWVAPILERGYIAHTFASIAGRGQHRAVACFERFRDAHTHVLQTDIYRFFPAIDHAVLKRDLARRIACPRTLALLAQIIDGSNAQEPVERYFAGDDLWTPMQRRRGLPLGNLSSQMLANFYLSPLDHYAKEVLRIKGYVRYLDDMAVFGASTQQLQAWQAALALFLDQRRLMLHPRKTAVHSCKQDVQFLGFVLLPGGKRRLPAAHVNRAVGRIARWRGAWARGEASALAIGQSVGAWIAHARHADTYALRLALFPKGWFCPRGEPARR